MLSFEQCFILFSSFLLLFVFVVGGLGFEFCMVVAGWRHALRSEWPFIIIIITVLFQVLFQPCKCNTYSLTFPKVPIKQKARSSSQHRQLFQVCELYMMRRQQEISSPEVTRQKTGKAGYGLAWAGVCELNIQTASSLYLFLHSLYFMSIERSCSHACKYTFTRGSLSHTINNNNNNNKRPLTPKSMPLAGDEHAKLKT